MTTIPTSGLKETNSEAARPIEREHAERFYDRLRNQIHSHLESGKPAIEKAAEFLLLVPDVFILLWRLLNDSRVNGKNKVLLGTGVAYFIFPFDIVPEAIVGPIGYLDDLVFGVYVLNRMLADTDVTILREHWSGREDVLDTIRNVLDSADKLVAGNLVKRLKKMLGVGV